MGDNCEWSIAETSQEGTEEMIANQCCHADGCVEEEIAEGTREISSVIHQDINHGKGDIWRCWW